jgi:hypothetical protein
MRKVPLGIQTMSGRTASMGGVKLGCHGLILSTLISLSTLIPISETPPVPISRMAKYGKLVLTADIGL